MATSQPLPMNASATCEPMNPAPPVTRTLDIVLRCWRRGRPRFVFQREEMDKVRSTELAAAFRRLGPLSPEQAEQIEIFSKALMNKFLHEPSVRLKAAAANGRGLGVVDAARYLFALEDKAQPGAPSATEDDD